QLAVGYGLLFGAGGGASYILVQQAVNLVVTRRRGLANCYVVSLLPAGAMIAAPLFGWCVGALGVRAALWALAGVLAATGMISAWLIAQSNVTLAPAGAVAAPDAEERRRLVFWQPWLVFFFAASAGLMVLSQAAGIITAYGGATTLAVYGTTFIAGMIAAARLGGGWMVDWLSIPTVASGADDLARGPTRLLPCAATLNGEDGMSRALVTSLAAFAAFASGAVDASAQGLVTMQKLSASLANELVGESVAACAQKGYTVTAVVVDLDGVRQALLRGNGAPIHTLDNAFY